MYNKSNFLYLDGSRTFVAEASDLDFRPSAFLIIKDGDSLTTFSYVRTERNTEGDEVLGWLYQAEDGRKAQIIND